MQDLVELYRRWQAGDSPRKIAKGLGISRNTARDYVRAAEVGGIAREQPLTPEQWMAFVKERFPQTEQARARAVWWSELDRYRGEIEEALRGNRVTTVWERMQAAGKVHASLSTFRRYVRAEMPRAVDPQRVVIHGVEGMPGELAEVDFGRLGKVPDPVSGQPRTIYAFIMVLVYSRYQFVRPVLRLDQETWLRCHLRAFSFFDALPQRIVLDNLKDGVIKPDIYDPQLNRAYAEMARHYNILLDPARSLHPKDKPHVERCVSYTREKLFRGREERFVDLDAGVAWAEEWCREEAGLRIHRTTGERPLTLFRKEEWPAMRPLPAAPWECCTWERGKVAADARCRVGGALYSVPFRLLDQVLDARLTDTRVEFYRDTELVKTHPRVARGGCQLDDADLPPQRIAFFRRTPEWCRQRAEGMGAEVLTAITEILEVHTYAHLRQAQRVLELEATYGVARLRRACARASAYGDPAFRTIKNILVNGLDQHPSELPLWPLHHPDAGAFLRGAAAFAPPGPADNDYAKSEGKASLTSDTPPEPTGATAAPAEGTDHQSATPAPAAASPPSVVVLPAHPPLVITSEWPAVSMSVAVTPDGTVSPPAEHG